MKRIALLILTNVAVMAVLLVTSRLLGVDRFLTANGLNLTALAGFSLIMGFGGAFISLLISKPMAKFSTGAQVINQPRNADEAWIVETVRKFANQAGIGMPDVGIFEGEPNAFATGAFKNSALVAVSTGLLQTMNREEVEAVIGHEVAHVANGDMVTMTLIQGVMNTFVVFLSRVIGYFVDKVVLRNEREGPGIGYYITTIVLDIVLGVLAGVVMGLSYFLHTRLHPRIIEVGLHPDGSLRDRHLWQLPPLAPHLYALRMDAELFKEQNQRKLLLVKQEVQNYLLKK